MALKNQNGNYLKITGVMVDTRNGMMNATGEIFENETARRNGLTEFQAAKPINVCAISNDFSEIVTADKSVKDTITTLAYNYLKANDYKGWSDC